MKQTILSVLFAFAGVTLYAQYYYQDILVTRQTNQQYKLLRSLETRKINAVSYEADDQPSKDFVLEQIISADGKQIVTRSASINNEESYFISTYNANRLVHTVDSSKNAINTVDYIYDNAGRILAVNSSSKDFDGTFITTENHEWTYNDKGLPVTMLKIKNRGDTTIATFAYDDDNNVSEETWKKKLRTLETYQYYYNSKKLLTDVVRYNVKAAKLLPDFLFDYDNAGHVTQMTQAQGGIANYLVWKFTYDANGLKEKEVVYNKKREMLGRIEYSYK